MLIAFPAEQGPLQKRLSSVLNILPLPTPGKSLSWEPYSSFSNWQPKKKKPSSEGLTSPGSRWRHGSITQMHRCSEKAFLPQQTKNPSLHPPRPGLHRFLTKTISTETLLLHRGGATFNFVSAPVFNSDATGTRILMHLFSRAAIMKYHKLGGLKKFIIPVLEARSPRSKCP